MKVEKQRPINFPQQRVTTKLCTTKLCTTNSVKLTMDSQLAVGQLLKMVKNESITIAMDSFSLQ